MLLSGILLPVQLAPGWLRFLSRINALGYVVDAERAVFLGDVTPGTVVPGSAIAVAAIVLGTLTSRRETSDELPGALFGDLVLTFTLPGGGPSPVHLSGAV